MIFYISDIHFDDQKIFDKCSRPFKDLNEYKEEIIKRWNKKVNQDDVVYVLGDIVEDNSKASIGIFKKLNGIKHFIVGNHDLNLLKDIEESGLFQTIKFMDLIDDNGRKVCICHYPVMDWMEFNRNGILVYGHVHNKTPKNGEAYREIKEYYKNKPAYNCGVDVTNYEPVTLDEMIMLKEANKNEPYIN
jgi:calcineurin-like phosphoesterase family protein